MKPTKHLTILFAAVAVIGCSNDHATSAGASYTENTKGKGTATDETETTNAELQQGALPAPPIVEALFYARYEGFPYGFPGLAMLQMHFLNHDLSFPGYECANEPADSNLVARVETMKDSIESIFCNLTDDERQCILHPLGYDESDDSRDLALGLMLYFGIGCEKDTDASRVLLGWPFSCLLDLFWLDGDAFSPYLCDDRTMLEVGYFCGVWSGEEDKLSPWQTAMGWFPHTVPVQPDGDTLGVPLSGAKPSFEEAVKWLRIGAENEKWNGKENFDRARAAFWLGMCHAWGYGVEKDMEEAATWFRKSCDYGGVGWRGGDSNHLVPNRPQICLAICKLLGVGTTRDLVAAMDNLYPRFMVYKDQENVSGWNTSGTGTNAAERIMNDTAA